MVLFLFDDLDIEQGVYFSECAAEAKDYLINEHQNMSYEEFDNSRLNSNSIHQILEKYNQEGYLFAAYSHGSTRSLLANQVAYLECGANLSLLKNAFVYTIACKAAVEFGWEATIRGAKAFIGYKDYSFSILDEHYAKLSRRCDNYALFLFLQGYNIADSVTKAKEHFNHALSQVGWHPIIKPALIANRDNLMAHGDFELTISTLLGR